MPKYDLFSLLEEELKKTNESTVEPVAEKGKCPYRLKELISDNSVDHFINWLETEKKHSYRISLPTSYRDNGRNLQAVKTGESYIVTYGDESYDTFCIYSGDCEQDLIYVDTYGDVWKTTLKIYNSFRHYYEMYKNVGHPVEFSMKYSTPKITNRLNQIQTRGCDGCYYLLNDEEEVWDILKKKSNYLFDFAKEKNIRMPATLLLAPQLEQLCKAEFGFADQLIQRVFTGGYNRFIRSTEFDMFNRLTQPGKNFKEIFKCSKTVYQSLKGVRNLAKWDIYRKMEKQGKVNKDTLLQAIDANYDDRDLNAINSILNKKYHDKPVFSWNTLQNYLVRLDQFQAIGRREAFQILSDYLTMCNTLDMEPRIDSDSLKREHDIAARILRDKRDEIMESKMEGACDYLKANDYTEGIYMIRGIRSYADLLDEAKQQHNCVAGYAKSIIQRKSLIYVMRRTDAPNESLITVEINPAQTEIRQKYLAYNQRIHNKSQSEFLDRWIRKVRTRVASGNATIQ